MHRTDGTHPPEPPTVDYSPEATLARMRKMQSAGNPTIEPPKWLLWAIMVIVCVGGWYWYKGLGVPDIPLCVVNTSSAEPLEIRLDGKTIGRAPQMLGEDPQAAVMGVLKLGEHKLEARTPSGTVVAQEQFAVREGSHGFLWTPLPDPTARFLFQVTDYGHSTGRAGVFPFHGTAALREFPDMVTQWFRDNPQVVQVRKGYKATYERALRRAP